MSRRSLARSTSCSARSIADRTFRFRNFREALAFVQRVGELAETEGHHPDISFGWGYATVSLSTKKIKGLCPRLKKIPRLQMGERRRPDLVLVRPVAAVRH